MKDIKYRHYTAKHGKDFAAGRQRSLVCAFRRTAACLVVAVLVVLCSVRTDGRSVPSPSPTSPTWEHISATGVSDDSDRIETVVRDGYIYITTSRPVNVKIFSILGQLISSTRVAAGSSRLKVPARGIYILKAGTYTRRLTV